MSARWSSGEGPHRLDRSSLPCRRRPTRASGTAWQRWSCRQSGGVSFGGVSFGGASSCSSLHLRGGRFRPLGAGSCCSLRCHAEHVARAPRCCSGAVIRPLLDRPPCPVLWVYSSAIVQVNAVVPSDPVLFVTFCRPPDRTGPIEVSSPSLRSTWSRTRRHRCRSWRRRGTHRSCP